MIFFWFLSIIDFLVWFHFVLYDLNYYKCFKDCFMTRDMVYLNVLLVPKSLMYSTVVWSSINVYKILLVKLFHFIVELFYIIDDFLSSYFIYYLPVKREPLKISNLNCIFVYWSFQLYYFFYNDALFWAYTFRIAVIFLVGL